MAKYPEIGLSGGEEDVEQMFIGGNEASPHTQRFEGVDRLILSPKVKFYLARNMENKETMENQELHLSRIDVMCGLGVEGTRCGPRRGRRAALPVGDGQSPPAWRRASMSPH